MTTHRVFCSPQVGSASAGELIGWMGGAPCLPDPADYPHRGGKPYQFMIQVDCARLPQSLWGGMGPRRGYLSVFMIESDVLDVKVLHHQGKGETVSRPDSWKPENSWLRPFADKFRDLLEAPVAWPLHLNEELTNVPSLQRPDDNSDFRISDAANQPFNWRTHKLLMREAINSLDSLADGYRDGALQRAATLHPASERLVQCLEEKKALAESLHQYFAGKSRFWKFNEHRWMRKKADHIRLRVLSDEWQMEINQGFLAALGTPKMQMANNIGNQPDPRLPSPLFDSATPAGKRYSKMYAEVCDIESELQSFEDLKDGVSQSGMPNYACWLTFRLEKPEAWQLLKQRVLDVRAEFYSFWLDNKTQVDKGLRGYERFDIPDSWDGALEDLERTIRWCDENLEKARREPSAEDMTFCEQRQESAKSAELASSDLREHLSGLSADCDGAEFDANNFAELYVTLDTMSDAGLLSDTWSTNYRVLRSELAKQIFAKCHGNLPNPVEAALKLSWKQDALPATVQMGGEPRAYCHSFNEVDIFSDEEPSQSILLFQIPSNHLTQFFFGDVSDLVISIPENALRMGHFEKACFDISN